MKSKRTENKTPRSSVKKPNPIDVHVGSRVRLRRMLVGMSQEKLGVQMGLTFQQIQKYEKGTNRIGASRLYQISRILEVPIQFFFEEASLEMGVSSASEAKGFSDSGSQAFIMEFLNTREGLELNRAFVRISDQKQRKRIVDLVRSMVDDTDETSDAKD